MQQCLCVKDLDQQMDVANKLVAFIGTYLEITKSLPLCCSASIHRC